MPVSRWKARGLATMCVALTAASVALAGCSRDDAQTTQPGQSQAADKPKAPTTGTNGREPTLGDYIQQSGITESQVQPGQPGTPDITLPMLPGWVDAGAAKPAYAYGTIIDGNPAFKSDPPSIVAVLSKLTGPVDPGEILKLAPNEIRNLPQFKGSDPRPGKLANFESAQISGTYVRDGQTRLIAQKTVVIPMGDALFVLQLNADGLKEQAESLMQATEAIDSQATIKV